MISALLLFNLFFCCTAQHQFSSVAHCIRFFPIPWTAACQATLQSTTLKLAQIHVHRVGDAIQKSHSLLSPSPPAFNLSSIRVLSLAWKIPWMEEPGRLQSMGSWRVRHDWATSLLCIGEGNGNPLQCSCLENPRDERAWWAAVSGVAQSWTRLKRLSSNSSSSQSIGVSALGSVLPMNIQDWFPLGLTGLISLQSDGLSRVFSKPQFESINKYFGTQLSL